MRPGGTDLQAKGRADDVVSGVLQSPHHARRPEEVTRVDDDLLRSPAWRQSGHRFGHVFAGEIFAEVPVQEYRRQARPNSLDDSNRSARVGRLYDGVVSAAQQARRSSFESSVAVGIIIQEQEPYHVSIIA